MTKPHVRWSGIVNLLGPILLGQILICCFINCLVPCFAHGQITYPEQEVRVHNLPMLTAQSPHSRYVLATSLEIVFHDKEVCCGKDSALDDSLQAADPKSLKDINSKVQGKHLLSDGRSILVTTEYMTPDQVTAGHVVLMILNQHAPLMMWNSRLYVVCGVTYVEDADYSTGGIVYVIHKYLLQDVRFSDSRREVSFDRVTEDPSKVQGLLFLQSEPQ